MPGFDSHAFIFKDGGWYRVDGTQPGPVSPFAPAAQPKDGEAEGQGGRRPEAPAGSPSRPSRGGGGFAWFTSVPFQLFLSDASVEIG